MLTRRSLIAAGLLAPVAAQAQAPSGGIIRIINPFPAGGSSDAIARLLVPGLQQRLGATVVVENKPGASGSIGGAMVAKSPPDGSTWLLAADSFVVSSLLMTSLPYVFLSSSIVKEIAKLGGPLEGLVPAHVEGALRRRFGAPSGSAAPHPGGGRS